MRLKFQTKSVNSRKNFKSNNNIASRQHPVIKKKDKDVSSSRVIFVSTLFTIAVASFAIAVRKNPFAKQAPQKALNAIV